MYKTKRIILKTSPVRGDLEAGQLELVYDGVSDALFAVRKTIAGETRVSQLSLEVFDTLADMSTSSSSSEGYSESSDSSSSSKSSLSSGSTMSSASSGSTASSLSSPSSGSTASSESSSSGV